MPETPSTEDRFGKEHAYGEHLASSFRVPAAPAHIHRTLRHGLLAISELASPVALEDPSASLGYDDAYQIAVQLAPIRHQFWHGNRFVASNPIAAGSTHIVDLRQDPRVLVQDPWRTAHFHLPIATMRAFSEQNDMGAFVDVEHAPTKTYDDGVMLGLAHAALAAVAHPDAAGTLLLDSILTAVCVNVLEKYYPSSRGLGQHIYGLAPWQERRAKQMMDQRLDVSLSDLARECGVSVAHFSRAFKLSTGLAPHRWQLNRRFQRARAMLVGTDLSLAEIALECGFTSQSHFSVSFAQHTGMSPGRWRRAHRE
jgi:AraC-like DNA-binding protein